MSSGGLITSSAQVGSSHHQLSSAQQRPAALAQQHSVSSAAQRHAVPFPGVLWCAVRRGTAVRCCEVLCATRSQLGLAWRIINSPPLSRAHRSASSAAQRRAVPRRAVPSRSLPCPARAMPCGSVLLLHGAVQCCAVLRVVCTFPTMPSMIPNVIPQCHTTGTTTAAYVPGTVC